MSLEKLLLAARSSGEPSQANQRSSYVSALPPPSENYDDDVLYGARKEAKEYIESLDLLKNSECITHSFGTFMTKQQLFLADLIQNDKRLAKITTETDIQYALPIQRYCWPQMDKSTFPLICLSPAASGKTYSYIIYIVAKLVLETPVSVTDKILCTDSSNENFDTKEKTPTLKNNDRLPSASVDQDNFDFNSLGPEKQSNETQNDRGDKTEEVFKVDESHLTTHPKYIIICSSYLQVDLVYKEIDRLKIAIFGTAIIEKRRKDLPPITRKLNHDDVDEKLALKCHGCEILVGTTNVITKCLHLNLINFGLCRKVIFDEFDVTLQLYNNRIREIIRILLAQNDEEENFRTFQANYVDGAPEFAFQPCQVVMFARKWTDLIKNCIAAVFHQRNIIFGSLAEASLLAQNQFDVDVVDLEESKRLKLKSMIQLILNGTIKNPKIAVVCETEPEARDVASHLEKDTKLPVCFLPKETALIEYNASLTRKWEQCASPVYVISDFGIDFVTGALSSINHLINYSMPSDNLIFDARFKLMYDYIQDVSHRKESMKTSIFLKSSFDKSRVKELFDLVSRSSSTLISTKLVLRDLMETNKSICWRWAATGLCRLEKLSRNDCLGSYCPERHSIDTKKIGLYRNDWPVDGQVEISIKRLVSPNEFYFWFEAYRNRDSPEGQWTKFENSGSRFMKRFQKKLNELALAGDCTVLRSDLSRGRMYGVYLPEERKVSRVILLEEPKDISCSSLDFFRSIRPRELSDDYRLSAHRRFYSQQCESVMVDYGYHRSIYLKNLFLLPQELSRIPAQSHRGFHLHVRPADDEPHWQYQSKKYFYDLITDRSIRKVQCWVRLNANNCFWFEGMTIKSSMLATDEIRRLHATFPHDELCARRLAEKITSEPSCLHPSERYSTLAKYRHESYLKYVQFAHFPKSEVDTVYVLHVDKRLQPIVRLKEFNTLLVDLEDHMLYQYKANKLTPLYYFAEGVYCLARIEIEGCLYINRCRLAEFPSSSGGCNSLRPYETSYKVECLDHGEYITVPSKDLYTIEKEHMQKLPFQAITGLTMADLNPGIFDNSQMVDRVQEVIYDKITRDETGSYLPLKCIRGTEDNSVRLYVPTGTRDEYRPLVVELDEKYGFKVCHDDYLNDNSRLVIPGSSLEDEEDQEEDDDPVTRNGHYTNQAIGPKEAVTHTMELIIDEIYDEIVDQALTKARADEAAAMEAAVLSGSYPEPHRSR